MIYFFSWGFQAIVVVAIVWTAQSNRAKCTWDAETAKGWLVKGIALIAFVQIADFIREYMTNGAHGLGLLYHIQWFGVYWIARAVCRRNDLRRLRTQDNQALVEPPNS